MGSPSSECSWHLLCKHTIIVKSPFSSFAKLHKFTISYYNKKVFFLHLQSYTKSTKSYSNKRCKRRTPVCQCLLGRMNFFVGMKWRQIQKGLSSLDLALIQGTETIVLFHTQTIFLIFALKRWLVSRSLPKLVLNWMAYWHVSLFKKRRILQQNISGHMRP